MLKQVKWGIIGCGDVTEVKSGPAFNQIEGSQLVAVMRRSRGKAEDYAKRHKVPRWYSDAGELLSDPEINAVYVATPPGSHAEYVIMAAKAGKHVYVEKPMGLNQKEGQDMIKAAENAGTSLFPAYYRRALPYFLKIKELLDSGAIGTPLMVDVRLFKSATKENFSKNKLPWRYKPEISGGGLFVDLASHQLDLLDYFFGPVIVVNGIAGNQAGWYPAEDTVSASFKFESGIIGNGSWCFTASKHSQIDQIEILGTEGDISFSTFNFTPIIIKSKRETNKFSFKRTEPIQGFLIKTIVDELRGKGKCPSTAVSGVRTSNVMGEILKDYYSNDKWKL